MRRNSLMTLEHNDLHLHALHKLSPVLPRHPTPCQEKVFSGKRKRSVRHLSASVWDFLWGLQQQTPRFEIGPHTWWQYWALIHQNPLNVPKPNIKHPDVRGGGHPRKLHVNRLEIREFEPCVFFRFSFPTLHSTMHEVCYFSDPFVIWRSSVEQWKTNSAGEFSTCLVSFSSLGA